MMSFEGGIWIAGMSSERVGIDDCDGTIFFDH